MVAGLVVGQLCGFWMEEAAAHAIAAVILLVPLVALAHRRAGTVALLWGIGALAGFATVVELAEGERREPAGSVRVSGQVREVRRGEWAPGVAWTSLQIEVRRAEPDSAGLEPGMGLALSIGSAARRWQIGDDVSFAAAIRPPRGFCNQGRDRYRAWLESRGVAATAYLSDDRGLEPSAAPQDGFSIESTIARMRGAIATAIDRAVTGDPAAVLRALVIGDRSGISRHLNDAYARTGAAHVLSVSGFHLALITGAALAALRWLLACSSWLASRIAVLRVAALAALVPASGYLLLSGAAIATARAYLMAALVLVGVALLRRSSPLHLLAIVAGILCALDAEALGDISFQLSFASVAGIIVAAELLERSRWRLWIQPGAERGWLARSRAWLLGAAAVSAAAGMATTPLTAFHFGSVSLVGIPVNLVVVPLIGVGALAAGLLGASLLIASPTIAVPCFLLADVLIRLGNQFVEWVAQWSWAALSVARPSELETLAVMGSLTLPLVVARWRKALLVVIGVGALCLGLRRDPFLVSFLDVGQGDATIVEMAAGRETVVIDAGGLAGRFDTGEGVVLPALRRRAVRSPAALVLSHAERDHYGGLAAVVRGSSAREIWWTGREGSGRAFEELVDTFDTARISRRAMGPGDRPLEAGRHGEILVLHPPRDTSLLSLNDASLVLTVRYGAISLLLSGDIEARGEGLLLRSGDDVAATVLKVPHHGSRTSSSEGLLRAVRPSLAVAMNGYRNRFGFPAREVVERHRSLGSAWRTTAESGELRLASDGQLVEVSPCRDHESEVNADA